MTRAYSVSHIHDEIGSTRARHYKALQAAQARKLADTVRDDDGRLISRLLAHFHDGLVVASSKLRPRKGEDVQVARI